MSRADDRGLRAATRAPTVPRVTLDWRAAPFTLRGEERPKWIREKNGRRVMCRSHGDGKATYWRAPRPRPRSNRRSRRRVKKGVIDAAMSRNTTPPESLVEAHVAIKVLQDALRAAIGREQVLMDKLQQRVRQSNQLIPQQPGDDVLPRNDAAESGFEGVTQNKAGWAAHTMRSQGNRTHLGTFKTPIEAARARWQYLNTCAIAAMVQQAPQWIPSQTFSIFWSLVLVSQMVIGIPWYLVPIGLILVYGALSIISRDYV